MIIVKLMGGLGNQMFQYATGRRLALVRGTDLKLDLSWFTTRPAMDTSRRFELAAFNIQASFATNQETAAFAEVSLFKHLGRLNRLIPGRLKKRYIREKHYHFDPRVLNLPDNVYLDGYWQCERYFLDIQDSVRKEFTVISKPDEMNRTTADKINCAESVSVHVRRGDYVSNPVTSSHHGSCSTEYYQRALEIISGSVRQPHYFVFSDDPGWAKQNLTAFRAATFLEENGPDRPFEDMRLMTLCKHHIIANSSFSWWGAWLCPNPEKVVIAPRQWFKNRSVNASDVVPETWVRI